MRKDTKKIFLISDLHFGVRSNSFEWLDIQKQYFENFLIPYIENNDPDDAELIIAGDVFDNRQSIHLMVMNTALDIITKLSEILPVHIIAGNHDIYRKSSTTINSLVLLKNIPGVIVYTEPKIVVIGDKTFFMMPWRGSAAEEKKCAEENPADYMVCHTDFAGIRFNRSTRVSHGNRVDDYQGYNRIFSGHIHYQQIQGNLVMLGCPYHLTRSDIGNTKCIWKLTLESDTLEYVANDFSPQFVRLKYETMLDQPFGIIDDFVKDNFVDIYVSQSTMASNNFPLNSILDVLSSARSITVRVEDEVDNFDDFDDQDLNPDMNFNLMKFAKNYITGLPYGEKIKDAIYKKIESLYLITIDNSD